jgi:stage II sporulation protein D
MRKFCLILLFFMVSAMPSFAIRIGLQDGVNSTYVGASKAAYVVDARTNKILLEMKPLIAYTIKPYGKVMSVKIGRSTYKLDTNWVIVKTADGKGFLGTKRRWYRGNLVIYNINKKLVVLNHVNLEDYLLGVVPSEMPSRWNIEAHKAQAIAARSYAIANLGKRGMHGYDLNDTAQDQVYGGATAEKPQTTRAVQSTRGIVLTYDGKIIPAYYHASSGGQTVRSNKVWAKDLPYIHSVNGYDSNVRKMGHGVGMSQYGANNLANQGYNSYQILNYFYKNIHFATLKSQM